MFWCVCALYVTVHSLSLSLLEGTKTAIHTQHLARDVGVFEKKVNRRRRLFRLTNPSQRVHGNTRRQLYVGCLSQNL